MPTAIKTAVMQHALDVAQMVKDNCVLRQGLPERLPRLILNEDPSVAAKAEPQPPVPVAPMPTPSTPQPSGIPWWAVPLLMAAGGAATGGVATYLLRPEQTVIERPAEQSPQSQSLLQYLEDNGYHLPPEKRGAK